MIGVRLAHHIADVVKKCEAQSFDDGDAVFSRAEPIRVAADRLQRTRGEIARADVVELKTAQEMQAAEIPALIKRNLTGRTVRFGDARAAENFQNVSGGESFEVPVRFEFEPVKILVAAKRPGEFGGERGLLSFFRKEARAARVPGDRGIEF